MVINVTSVQCTVSLKFMNCKLYKVCLKQGRPLILGRGVVVVVVVVGVPVASFELYNNFKRQMETNLLY